MTTARESLRTLLEHFEVGMLITIDDRGRPRARPMWLAQIDEHDDLWFLTAEHSAKIDELRHHAGIGVTFQNRHVYVSLSGRAEVHDDPDRIRTLWIEPWRHWFSEGPDDPQLRLLRFRTETGEYWDVTDSKGLRHVEDRIIGLLRGHDDRPAEGGEEHAVVPLG